MSWVLPVIVAVTWFVIGCHVGALYTLRKWLRSREEFDIGMSRVALEIVKLQAKKERLQ